METAISISSALCLLLGSFLCLSGGVGILRFPDFYTRMHAVGVTDTLGAGMILVGLMLLNTDSLALLNPDSPVRLKLLLILLMTLFINPAASHALAKAAIHSGLLPLLDNKKNEGGVEPSNP